MGENVYKLARRLSFKEELANSITHGIGTIGMLVLIPISAIYAYKNYDIKAVVGISIFVISLFLMFLTSTVYHSMDYESKHKRVLRVIDHSMIFVAIAGSYTPIALSVIGGITGIVIVAIQWILTIIGIIYKSIALKSRDRFGLILYIAMGWMAVLMIPKLIKSSNPWMLVLIVLGGICYTLGVVFYVRKRPFSHTIWHAFILFAATSQYIGIVYFLN